LAFWKDEPAVVIIAIDVENLLALDAEDTGGGRGLADEEKNKAPRRAQDQSYPESTHSVRPGQEKLASVFGLFRPGGNYLPVPSTMTSYSLATSSMVETGCEIGGGGGQV
jgi:hypothetical protein